ncbi:MAG: hypothetical protein ACT4PV_05025 [Planctomycetaceae bacterium]
MRLWVGTGLAVAALVVGILLLTRPGPAHTTGAPGPKPLTDAEVDIFIDTFHAFQQLVDELYLDFSRGQEAEPGAAEGRMEQALEALARRHKLAPSDLRDSIWPRVRLALEDVRWSRSGSAQRVRVEETITRLQEQLDTAQLGETAREYLEKQLAFYQQIKDSAGRRALEADRQLIERRFDQLDPIVPRQLGG